MPLNIIFEDSDILIINKPYDLVVHLGYGHTSGTLFNSLIYHYKESINLPRAGIVHRLDRHTTGLLVIAKKIAAYQYLLDLFKTRKIIKEYDVIVVGRIERDGEINRPIKRHIFRRTKMMVSAGGKESITRYQVIAIFRHCTYLRVRLETGRTHQIRVHFSSISHPVLGDQVYDPGFRARLLCSSTNRLHKILFGWFRPALHARRLTFIYPSRGLMRNWVAGPPSDMVALIHCLYEEDMK
nr:RluA family pseudouridine synthase [Buchnera aphidicola]